MGFMGQYEEITNKITERADISVIWSKLRQFRYRYLESKVLMGSATTWKKIYKIEN